MEKLNKKELKWLHKAINEKEKYRIYVDNDEVFICDMTEDECVFTFNHYGYEFVVQLLIYMGADATLV